MAEKDARLSQLSHDLRSALADILGGLQLIDRARLDDETQTHFERIRASGETLGRLLELSIVDDLRMAPVARVENIDLTSFLQDIQARWRGRALENRISFELNRMTSLPAIVTLDRVSLDRILDNLLSNAHKYTDIGQVVLTVDCLPDNSLCFCVEDTGPGFSEEARSRMFEFAGRPNAAAKPGTGLGLNIAKELAIHAGASLEIGNRVTGGARAMLCFPHDTWSDRSLKRPRADLDAKNGPPVSLDGVRILLAEDNETNQLVATKMLHSLGAEVVIASDGAEALERLQSDSFDLALLDIEMPRMTGVELMKILRNSPPPLSEMPLVALTAYVMQDHRDLIYAAGADGIIAKPVMSISEFGAAIQKHLCRSENARSGRAGITENHSNPKNAEVVDRAIFDNLVETIGPNSIAELLQKLQADTDAVAEGIGRASQSLDLSLIRSQTHILISVAGAVGAKPLVTIAQKLNLAANQKGAKDVEDLCESCLTGLKELQGFILREQARHRDG